LFLNGVTSYYNSVSSLQEIYRLRFNQKLQELDLRLNPVARNEPDYRLFIIHMLPNLRRLGERVNNKRERELLVGLL
jgi:centrosomal protein CEP72